MAVRLRQVTIELAHELDELEFADMLEQMEPGDPMVVLELEELDRRHPGTKKRAYRAATERR